MTHDFSYVTFYVPFASLGISFWHNAKFPANVLHQLLYDIVGDSVLAGVALPELVVQIASLRVGALRLV